MKTYQALFIFDSTHKDDAVDKILESIRGEISKLGGEVQDVARLGMHEFAREMKKKTTGHYVRMRFQIAPDKLQFLNARLKLNENVFRSQIVVAPKVRPPAEKHAEVAEEKEDGQS